ncbi:NERD domain-containing protein [Aeromicrobium sp. CFBP 8757]|uniref:nuclease-related domain-containing DEAD/DEAH box helicase n=1 Tax=Aeromicrobium sp. CFBP 8757 TaxID=2775288 RepID=UPI00178668EC|nr:NERD domain-containing protein [Aeromicrobium sp. CFBP 8757]MBD8606032.1 NERD domain-containing protein [Aeromicrobium sp. CFBP 8757]
MSTPMLWPDAPKFASGAEQRVWTALHEQLGENDLLIANQRFTDHQRDYELDIAVVFDGLGVVVLEVKGGKVWVEDGKWFQELPGGVKRRDPVEQAMTAKHVLKKWVEESMAWAGKRPILWAHGIVLPNVRLDPGFDMPDCHRWMVVDRDDMSDIVSRLRNILTLQDKDVRACDGLDIVAIHEALQGRFLPQRVAASQPSDDVADRVAEHDDVIERLSLEQSRILDFIQAVDQVEIRGGAGSGKTWLAVEQARRLTREGKRVALMSYSRGLSVWMKRRLSTFGHKDQPAYVGTFHGLGLEWGATPGSDNDSDFWENRLPQQMLQLVRQREWHEHFDAIVIDEAQDFADSWWPVVLEALKYEDSGLYVFTDEGQRIFQRFGDSPAGLVPLILDRNLRNTKQISQTFSPMAPNRLRVSQHDGEDVRFVECAHDEALDRADDLVDQLIEEGWEPSDIAVLATGPRHPEQKARQEAGWEHYWDSFWDKDQVFYGHVSGFKGLERPAVILAVNEGPDRDRAKERLYVGLSRARDLLVVCGDPAHIEKQGGTAVLKRLKGTT